MVDEPRETPMGDIGYIASIVACRLFARLVGGETLPRHTLAGRARDDWFVRTREFRTSDEAFAFAAAWTSTSVLAVDVERIVIMVVVDGKLVVETAFNYKLTDDGVAISTMGLPPTFEDQVDFMAGFNHGFQHGENSYTVEVDALGEYRDPSMMHLESGFVMLDDPEEQESV
jgi:hypothetical protein